MEKLKQIFELYGQLDNVDDTLLLALEAYIRDMYEEGYDMGYEEGYSDGLVE